MSVTTNRKIPAFWVLMVIPAYLAILMLLWKKVVGCSFMWRYDPAYAYLFNGLNIANSNLELGHTDHPGTPLQLLIALVIRIVYLFKGEGEMTSHVLHNTELYLGVVGNVILFINIVLVFMTGWFLYRYTKNIYAAFVFQLIPLFSNVLLAYFSVVMTESFYFIPLVIFFLFLIIYTICEIKNTYVFVLVFGIMAGTALATKISVAPLLIVPIFTLRTFRQKAFYLVLIPLTFICCTIPILEQYGKMLTWFKNLFIHSGVYGKGQANIIDTQESLKNLKAIFSTDILFTIPVIILIAGTIYTLFNKRLQVKPIYKRTLLGITLALFLQIMLVAKHYAFRYLIPAQMALVPGFILLAYSFGKTIRENLLRFKTIVIFLFTMFLCILTFVRFDFPENFVDEAEKTRVYIVENINKKPVIIEKADLKAVPFIEVANYFGSVYSGGSRNEYFSKFQNDYPVSLFYAGENERLYTWTGNVNETYLACNFDSIYYYFNEYSPVYGKFIENELVKEAKLLYKNEATGDVLYNLYFDTSYLSLFDVSKIVCNMENVDSMNNVFLSNVDGFNFTGAKLRTNEIPYQGNFSCLLDNATYGSRIDLKVNKGDQVSAGIFKYPEKANVVLTASYPKPGVFYQGNVLYSKVQGSNWKHIGLNFSIPESLNDSTIRILFYRPGNQKVYVDNFEITYFKRKTK